MRLDAAPVRFVPALKAGLMAACALVFLSAGTAVRAQSVPETIRINVEPPEPGIRSITVNKKYRPIINRDDKGVVIDTMGSDNKQPPCEVKLEVTLENSRVLHRDANICSGSTLVVDVSSDGKPGAVARIVGTGTGTAAGPVTQATGDTPSAQNQSQSNSQTGQQTQTASTGEQPQNSNSSITEIKPPEDNGGLEPLDRVDTPISVPGTDGTETASLPADNGVTGSPVLVSANEAREWLAEPGSQPGSPSVLQHGVPQTDDRDFRADCTTQSGFAKITFQQAPGGLQEGMPQAVRITAGDFESTYNAFGSSAYNEAGVSLPEVNIEMIDPLWEAMIRQSELSISVEGLPAYQVSLKGSANPVRLFVATCSQPQQIVTDAAYGTGAEEASSDLSCGELGRVRSLEAVRPGQIVFRNASRQPVEVHWIDYRGGERPYARLEPGQILEQQTFVSHAWALRGAGGECRGIYVTKTPYREVVINGPAETFGLPGNDGFGNNNGFDNNSGWGSPNGGGFDNQPGGGFPAGPVPPGAIEGNSQPNFQQQTAQANVADYLCTAGIDLNVVFSPDMLSATVAEMGYGAVTLQRQGGANTFYFESQGHVLKGQLQNATWSRPGLRDVFCARR
ncbi:VHL beta domain-containing protein [Roseibium sp. M-1]